LSPPNLEGLRDRVSQRVNPRPGGEPVAGEEAPDVCSGIKKVGLTRGTVTDKKKGQKKTAGRGVALQQVRPTGKPDVAGKSRFRLKEIKLPSTRKSVGRRRGTVGKRDREDERKRERSDRSERPGVAGGDAAGGRNRYQGRAEAGAGRKTEKREGTGGVGGKRGIWVKKGSRHGSTWSLDISSRRGRGHFRPRQGQRPSILRNAYSV